MVLKDMISSRNGTSAIESGHEQDTSQVAAVLAEQSKGAINLVGKTIRKHPGISLGIAAAAGVALGWWMKRK